MNFLEKLKIDRQNLVNSLCENINSLEKIAFEQQTEIKKLKIELQAMRGSANSYKKAYEELRQEQLDLIRSIKHVKSEAIKEIADKITEVFERYKHLHEYADKARRDTIETFDLTEIEIQSVWDVLTLKKNDMANYEEMGRLQKNIEIIAMERLLTELEKDFYCCSVMEIKERTVTQ